MTTAGDRMGEDLRWVHGMLRRDLATVRELAAEIAAGGHPDDVGDRLRRLQTQSPLWQLRSNCLYYCQLVHHHHHLEDIALFPAVRAANPALSGAVDRLESDHRKVSDLLDRVEALAGEARDGVNTELVDALRELSDHLLEHLDFEEATLIPEFRTWTKGLW
jgi:Hemerythrin HHE cation binding domain